jgi:hypothetical protein
VTDLNPGQRQLIEKEIVQRALLGLDDSRQRGINAGTPDGGMTQAELLTAITFDGAMVLKSDFAEIIEWLKSNGYLHEETVETGDSKLYLTDEGQHYLASVTNTLSADLISAAVIRVRRLELVDNQDRLRGVIDCQNGENPRFLMSDAKGEPRMILGVRDDRVDLHLAGNLLNPDGSKAGIMIAAKIDGTSTIYMQGKTGSVMINITEKGDPVIAVHNAEGELIGVVQ